MTDSGKKKPADLLAQARERARLELEALRAGKKPERRTLLTGYRRFNAPLP